MPANLVAEVLAGDADRPRAGGFEDIPLQVIPLFWMGQGDRSSHLGRESTSALVALVGGVKRQGGTGRSDFLQMGSNHLLPAHQER